MIAPAPSLFLLSAGSNAQGQLATGNDDDAHVFTPCLFSGCSSGSLPPGTLSIVQIACGANHTLALLSRVRSPDPDSNSDLSDESYLELWGCGDGRKGQLGPTYLAEVGYGSAAVFRPIDLQLMDNLDLSNVPAEGYAPRMVAAGWETSYMVVSCAGHSDLLLSMGADDYGNLGIGGTKGKAISRQALHIIELSPLVESSGILSIKELATGPHHVVVRFEIAQSNGSARSFLAGWGAARQGQLGVDTHKPLSFLSSPRIISLAQDVTSVALGNQHTVLLHATGRISGLGSDRKGQLHGLGALSEVKQIGCTWNGTIAILSDVRGYRIVGAGSSSKGQLGRGTIAPVLAPGDVHLPPSHPSRAPVKLVCGSEHVLCLFACPTDSDIAQVDVWAWGWNEHGNLGLGSIEDAHLPVRIWPPAGVNDGSRVVDIWCGNGTSWILLER